MFKETENVKFYGDIFFTKKSKKVQQVIQIYLPNIF